MAYEREGKPLQQRTERQSITGPGEPNGPAWAQWLMASGVLLAALSLFILGRYVLVPRWDLVRGLVLCACVGLLLPYRWTGTKLGLERLEWVLFNVLGVGPWTFTVLLAAHLLFHGTPTCSAHAVTSHGIGFLAVTVELEDGAFAEHLQARRFDPARFDPDRADSLHICTAAGLFGPGVVVERELIASGQGSRREADGLLQRTY